MQKLSRILLILSVILATLYFSRWMIMERFNFKYLDDLYATSQWRIPMSARVMSDNELYQLAGYKIVTGTPVDEINSEVPPLGKFLYGISISWFGSPYVASFLLYLGSILIFWQLASSIFHKQPNLQFWAVLFFVISPLFASQLSRSMLDLPQLFFLLAHILTIILLTRIDGWRKQLAVALAAGLLLGWFGAIKIGVFVPIIFLVDLVWLWLVNPGHLKKSQRLVVWLQRSALIGAGAGLGYILVYAPYFMQGHSLIDWLKFQKWTVSFYAQSREQSPVLILLTTILSGWYNGWWTDQWQQVYEWSVLWPLATAGIIVQLVRTVRKKIAPGLDYISLMGTSLLLAMAVIPFWPRYFLLILPLGILSLIPLFYRYKVIKIGLCIIVAIQFGLFFRQQPLEKLSFAVENWNHGQYRDFYNHLSPKSKENWSADTFVSTLENFEYTIKSSSRSATLTVSPTTWWQQQTPAELTVKFETPLGPYINNAPVTLNRVDNVWQIDWSWEIIAKEFSPLATVEVQYEQVDSGKIITKDEVILSKQIFHPFVLVIKEFLPNDPQPLIHQLSELTEKSTIEIENQLFVENPRLTEVPIGFLPLTYVPTQLTQLQTHPAIKIEQRRRRVINPGLSTFAEKIDYIEHTNPSVLGNDGGKIYVKGFNGETTLLLDSVATPGQDLILDKTVDELFEAPALINVLPTLLNF